MARQTRERVRRLNWLTEAQAAIGWGIILILAALIGAIYLRQISQIATVGRQMQIKQYDLAMLKRENAGLEQRIAEAQSLHRLQQEASRLGFIPARPEDVEFVIVPNYPLITDNTAVSTLVPSDTHLPIPPATLGEAVWLNVRRHITSLIRGEASEQ